MEEDYVALPMTMKELLTLQDIIIEVCKNVGLSRKELTSIHSTVWEDNAGCVILTNLELPRMTPRSKHYADCSPNQTLLGLRRLKVNSNLPTSSLRFTDR